MGLGACTGTSAAARRRSTWRARRLLAEVLIAGSRDGMLDSAHDLSDGGLAQALVESALAKGVGARIALPAGPYAFVQLFSESAGRVLVSVSPAAGAAASRAVRRAGRARCTRLGVTGW